MCASGQAVIAGCNLRAVHFSATSLAGCNHAVGCSNCQLFELCFLFLIKHFLLGVGYIVILSKCVNVAKMSKHIFKRLTLAQCIDVHCRPTVVGCRPLHSIYLHTPLMCIVPWQSGAYALKQSALYIKIQPRSLKVHTVELIAPRMLQRDSSLFEFAVLTKFR